MDIELINRFAEIGIADPKIAALRQITTEQLRHLGQRQIAYLRGDPHDGGLVFVLCGADGASILMLEDIERAAEAATQLGLELIALH